MAGLVIILLLFCALAVAGPAPGDTQPPPKAGPPFRSISDHGVWWLAAPDGRRFFSLGVCCVGPGTPWAQYDPNNPGYAAYQHYENPVAWADTTLTRLKSWNYTTIGGWSDLDLLRRSRRMDMPFTVMIPIGMGAGAPWLDMWDPKVIAAMDGIARAQIEPVRDNPHLIGYYTDNELGWWNAGLFLSTLKQPPASGQRQRLIRLLRQTYGSHWTKLLNDFVPVGASSFAALDKKGTLYLRPGGSGIRAVKKFVSLAADRYYHLVRNLVRKYDRRGLILGDRYQSFYYPEVARAAAKYVDVISTNLNPNWNDGTVARFYLDTLHVLTQKPVMVTEFYAAAMENRSGNKNDSSGFLVVPTQAERADCYRRSVQTFLARPYVVGADWFQYYDEPTHGRDDGENYDMGLVDIHDRPYETLTAASASLNLKALHQRATARRSDASSGVPRAPRDPLAGATAMEMMRDWDRERGFVPAASKTPVADLYVAWDKDAVYFGIYAMDIVEKSYYRDGVIPEQDRMELRLSVNGLKKPIRVRLGAGRPPVFAGPSIPIRHHSGLEHDNRNVTILQLPAAMLGRKTFAEGDPLNLTARLVTHARAYRTEWRARLILRP